MWEKIAIVIKRDADNQQVGHFQMAVWIDDQVMKRKFEIPVSNAGVYINDNDQLVMNFTVEVEGE